MGEECDAAINRPAPRRGKRPLALADGHKMKWADGEGARAGWERRPVLASRACRLRSQLQHARACGHLALSRLNSPGWRRARGRYSPITGQGSSGYRPRGQTDQWDNARWTRAAPLPDARPALRVRRRAAGLSGPATRRAPGAVLSGFHLDELLPASREFGIRATGRGGAEKAVPSL